jgi:hypothetical protein
MARKVVIGKPFTINTGCGRETGDYVTTVTQTLYLQNYKNIVLKYTSKRITI